MEETISLKEIFEVIKKRLLLIILLMVGAAGISAIVSFFILTPTYEASSQFLVKQDAQANMEYNSADIRTSLELINTYNDIIKSPRILDVVAEEIGAPLSSEAIQISSGQNSQVVTVTVTDTDPSMAAEIANTTVEVFQDEVPILLNVNNVNILTEAVVPANPQPVNPKPLLNIAIGLVLGLMVGVGLAFLLEYLDNTIKNQTDIENKLELPVLGVIPHIKEDDIITSQFNPAVKKRRGRGDFDGQKKKTV
ncbi:capsular biosynthesis protein [Aquibacillus halophilus]|uniref:Capsular biosynthesis protein n=1 Tax=Aquibacillus halophilus TaxID=930132 RepID=A0A6A8D642_9BACI|nr:Wzz/FepE/Etk N-terminal domain-containing protein [Aquibacillus halophilus]MRH41245.1 capsular biosynthesis protein [Aquibacillus halophilus]